MNRRCARQEIFRKKQDDEAFLNTLAETQLLYASDWPHRTSICSSIFDLPFLSDQAKRNIPGETALKLFSLERPNGK